MSVADQVLPSGNSAGYDSVAAALDERTLEILEHRRRRGRSAGAAGSSAGCCSSPTSSGSSLAFFVAPARRSAAAVDFVGWRECSSSSLTLPAWIVLAKLYGLYDHDEERTDHTTVDDVVGVFHLVTVTACGSASSALATGSPHLDEPAEDSSLFWAPRASCFVTDRPQRRALVLPAAACRYLQNTHHRRRRRRRPAGRAQDPPAPRVRDQPRRLRRRAAEGAPRRARAPDASSARPTSCRSSSSCSTSSA